VVGVYDKCVPQPRTDVFPHSIVTGRLTLRNLVEDQPILCTGPVVIKKGEPQIHLERNRFAQPTEIESMDLSCVVNTPRGPVEVQIFESPELQSRGLISGQADLGSTAAEQPLDSSFSVNAVVRTTMPDGTSKDYHIRNASMFGKIASNPPGAPAQLGNVRVNRYCSQEEGTPLYDPETGEVVGSLKGHCHDPNPPKIPPPKKHVPVPCDNASIDVEYIEPAVLFEEWDKEKGYWGKTPK
jgi:hypothetical protein